MARRTALGFGLVAGALVLVAILGATGVVRIPYVTPEPAPGLVGDAPGEVGLDPAEAARLAAAGGRPKDPKALPTAPSGEPAVPSEAKGTALGGNGGTIRGRVVEGEGKAPVVGALVELRMPDALFHWLHAEPAGRFDRLRVATDAQGRFRFDAVLPWGGYALDVRRTGGAPASRRELALSPREDLDVGEILLGRSGGLAGRVVGADGQALAAARVAVSARIRNEFDVVLADPDTLPWTEAVVTTDAEGAWRAEGLEPGEKHLVVKAATGEADVVKAEVVAGTVTTVPDLALASGLAIAGVVEWADRSPVVGARIFAKTMQKEAAHTVTTGADGAFRLPGLAAGVYFVGVFVPGMSVHLVPGKRAGDEAVRISLALPGSVTGKVVAKATGRAIPQLRVTPVFTDAQDFMAQYVAQRVDRILGGAGFAAADGVFRFERVRPGSYRFRVEAEGWPTAESVVVEVKAGTTTTVPTVELADGHHVAGAVRDARGAPIAGARIALRAADRARTASDLVVVDGDESYLVGEADDAPADVVSEADGTFRSPALTPRAYTLHVRREGFVSLRGVPADVSSRSLDALDLRLAAGAKITVRVADPRGRSRGDVPVAFVSPEHTLHWFATGPDGTIVANDLSPGAWTVVYAGTEARRAFGVEAGRTDDTARAKRADAIRAVPGALRVDAAADTAVERTLRVPVRVSLSGQARLDRVATRTTWCQLAREGASDAEWFGVQPDGSFEVRGVEPGRYVVRRQGPDGGAWADVAVLDVSEEDRTDVVLDLSK